MPHYWESRLHGQKSHLMRCLDVLKDSAHCALCMQAAFGAPIGGVLFSMEEACTHWSRKVSPGGGS